MLGKASLILLFCLFLGTAAAQNRLPGQLLVWLESPDSRPISVLPEGYRLKQQLCRKPAIFLLETPAGLPLKEALRQMNAWPSVRYAQPNHRLQHRTIWPDDPLLPEQWAWSETAGLQADWAQSQGGLTAFGDPIVIAVLDDGLRAHPDLVPNLWVNTAEIPNNHIDDDQNGYVDDYRGWNVSLANDHVHLGHHGTQVAGVAAARGNNGLGIAGLAWQSRIMPVVCGNTEAEAIAAYAYVLAQRERYNETGGQSGSLVVASNTSWGVDGLSAEEAPIWCAFYDYLGAAGILNCAATANGDWDVGSTGDMPSSCSSDYLLTVTAVDSTGQRNGAYGAEQVDLAAPGVDILTTSGSGQYALASGTSYASPMAAALTALLYAAPCPDLAALALSDPAEAALQAKQWMMESVDVLPQLEGMLYSSGRLNVARALQRQAEACSPCPPLASFRIDSLSANGLLVSWEEAEAVEHLQLYWRSTDELLWNLVQTESSAHWLSSLQACTTYELMARGHCAEETESPMSQLQAQTLGCCPAPSAPEIEWVENGGMKLSWKTLEESAYSLVLTNGADSLHWSGTEAELLLSELPSCTEYTGYLYTHCSSGRMSEGQPFQLVTPGCGSCTDLEYCHSAGGEAGAEWIDYLTLGGFAMHSGHNDGSASFLQPSILLSPGRSYPLSVRLGFLHLPYPEYLRIWIDLDQDGSFNGAGELLLDTLLTGGADSLYSMIQLPAGVETHGATRMRVTLKWAGAGHQPPQPCDPHIAFGEVEDYCVRIADRAPARPFRQEVQDSSLLISTVKKEGAGTAELVRLWPNPFRMELFFFAPAGSRGLELRLTDAMGRPVLQRYWPASPPAPVRLALPHRLPPGLYNAQLRWDGGSAAQRLIRQP